MDQVEQPKWETSQRTDFTYITLVLIRLGDACRAQSNHPRRALSNQSKSFIEGRCADLVLVLGYVLFTIVLTDGLTTVLTNVLFRAKKEA